MTAEIVLSIALLGTLLFHFRASEAWREERRLLLNMSAARSTSELSVLQQVTKPGITMSMAAQARKEGRDEPEPSPKAPSLPHGL